MAMSISTLPAIVDPDEEVHRDEHRVPEDIEEEQVERDEDPDHRRLERQHEDRELLHLLLDRFPRREQRDRRQEPGEHHEEQADPVDTEVVVDAKRWNPGHALDELELRRGRIELRPQRERDPEGDQRHHERQPADQAIAPPVAVADEQQQQCAGKRQRPGECQHVKLQ
jgi:hypothetical protein